MKCPMYIDSMRECHEKIDFIPQNTFLYCLTERYKECPLFKAINNMGPHCEYLNKCPAYKHFGAHDFEKFVEITDKYCLSENNINCERFKLRKDGKEVPSVLLPDGTKLIGK